MPTFVLTYRLPDGAARGSAAGADAWSAWFQQLGASLADRGNPVFSGRTLGNCGSGTSLGGYSLITAEDLETAAALAQGCPALAAGGGVEAGELTVLDQEYGRYLADHPSA